LEKTDEQFRQILTTERLRSIVSLVPEDWLRSASAPSDIENRKVYEQFLINRVSHSSNFVKEAQHARKVFI
ncbi:MAG TPA: aminotransferase class I and II, partial [Flavisolibacter sp.]|nr:aminotransferase class I and II [Flavisolibacter sp.]